jgi:hypothetical protein
LRSGAADEHYYHETEVLMPFLGTGASRPLQAMPSKWIQQIEYQFSESDPQFGDGRAQN